MSIDGCSFFFWLDLLILVAAFDKNFSMCAETSALTVVVKSELPLRTLISSFLLKNLAQPECQKQKGKYI